MEFVLIAIAILVVGLVAGIGLLVSAGRRTTRLDDDAATGTTLTQPRPPETGTPAPPAPSGSTASGLGLPPETAELPPRLQVGFDYLARGKCSLNVGDSQGPNQMPE